ncbi:MAG: hypothetical protein JXA25_09970 [Anaerolineales bacterium]|nr:hypothetical protein [Anaerolineales bacterium]
MSWVSNQIFAAGGTAVPDTWKQFQAETGITTVVHLNPGSPSVFQGPLPARYLWLDIADENGADNETRYLAAKFVLEAVYAGDSILLHATPGRHRTRWIFVAYLILSGRKTLTAVRLAEQLPWLAPYHTDLQRWELFAEWIHHSEPGGLDAI